jgi:hypothetical protein
MRPAPLSFLFCVHALQLSASPRSSRILEPRGGDLTIGGLAPVQCEVDRNLRCSDCHLYDRYPRLASLLYERLAVFGPRSTSTALKCTRFSFIAVFIIIEPVDKGNGR